MFSSLNSTWSYENRVSKHFVIFLNFPCLRACLLCCLLMTFFLLVLWLGIYVEVDVDRIIILPSPPPSLLPYFLVPTHNSLLNTSDSYNLYEISARLKLVSVPFSSTFRYSGDIGHLEKSFPESRSCKILRWDKVITIRRVCIV